METETPESEHHNSGKIVKLSKREMEVLLHVKAGKTNREIARILNISPNTVKSHLDNIFTKLDVQNRTQAAMKSVQKRF